MLYDLMALLGYGLGLLLLVGGLVTGVIPAALLGAGVLAFALLSDGAIAQNPATEGTAGSRLQAGQSEDGGSVALSLLLMLLAIGALLLLVVGAAGIQ